MGKLHTVAETAQYLSDCKAEGVSDEVMATIVNAVAADPSAGDQVAGSGGLFKRRFGGRGAKGKSGSYRVLVAFVGDHAPAYLIALLGKGDRANFTKKQVIELRKLTDAIKQSWRSSENG